MSPSSPSISSRVLITGAQGQDGTLLIDYLKRLNISFLGVSKPTIGTISDELFNSMILENNIISANLADPKVTKDLLLAYRPTHIFHFATKHGPNHQMNAPEWKNSINRLFETQVSIFENLIGSIRSDNKDISLIVAGSSRMYDPYENEGHPVNESTMLSPVDSYGEAKAKCMKLSAEARKEGLRVSTAILFNHESALRKQGYLFPELATGIARYLAGHASAVQVRNANSKGDWHAAHDTVMGMWMQSNLKNPQDILFCSGQVQSISNLIKDLFENYFQDMELPPLISTQSSLNGPIVEGDNSLAKSLGWQTKVSVTNILFELVTHKLANWKVDHVKK